MTVKSSTELLKLIRSSGLFDEKTLERLQANIEVADEPGKIARQLVTAGLLTEWQAKFLLSGRSRLKVGQYILLERMPSHTIGDRFLALHRQLDRYVEFLVFPPNAADNQQLFQRFVEQACKVATLDHPNLIHLYDIDQDHDRYYFVFEHDSGTNVEIAPIGSLDAWQIASIAKQSLEGIQHAHGQGIIHGKLSSAEIKLDSQYRVKISNLGLMELLDRLREATADVDEFAIPAVPADDIIAIGRIARHLFDQHIGQAKTPDQQSLGTILSGLASFTPEREVDLSVFIEKLSSWMESAEEAKNQKLTEEPESAGPARQSKRPARSGQSPENAILSRNKLPLLVMAAAIGALLLVGGYYYFGGGRQQQSKNQNPDLSIDQAFKNRDLEANESIPSPPSGQDTSSGQPNKPKDDPPLDDSVAQTPLEISAKDFAKKTVPDSTTTTNRIPSPAEAKAPLQSRQNLPHVRWNEARSVLDQEAFVSGNINYVGGNRYIRFLEFGDEKDDFQVVIKKASFGNFDGDLKKVYKSKNVVVRGLVHLFEDKKAPQIEVTDPSQIIVVDELPPIGGPMAVNADFKLPGDKRTAGAAKTSAVVTPFASLSSGFALPVYEKDLPLEKRALGPIHSQGHPLGLELHAPAEISSRKLRFELSRDQLDKNKYHVLFAERLNDEPGGVATFSLENDQLYFQWVASEFIRPSANYLQNCRLELKIGQDSRAMFLRKPVLSQPIVFTEKKTALRHNVDLSYLPTPEIVTIEFLPLPQDEFETQTTDSRGLKLSLDMPETAVFFEQLPNRQFLKINYAADIGNRIRIDAALELNSPSGYVPFKPINLKRLGDLIRGRAIELRNEYEFQSKIQAPTGQKTKQKNYVKGLSKDLELINSQVEAFALTEALAPKLLNRKLTYRIYCTIEGLELELASPNISNIESAD